MDCALPAVPDIVEVESVRVGVVPCVGCVTVIVLDADLYPPAVATAVIVVELLGNVKVAELPLKTGLGEKVTPVALSLTGTFGTLTSIAIESANCNCPTRACGTAG